MDSYIGTKIVRAAPMTPLEFSSKHGRVPAGVDRPDEPGYEVVYEDSYTSWSPKDVFERCYRRVTDQEKALINA